MSNALSFSLEKKVLLVLSLLLTLEFIANTWLGFSAYSEKPLVLKDTTQSRNSVTQILKVRMSPELFDILNPILVGDALKEAELKSERDRVTQEQLAKSSSGVNSQLQILTIDSFQFRLIATFTVGGKSKAIIHAAKVGEDSQEYQLGINDSLLGKLNVVSISPFSVGLKPILDEQNSADFEEVRLHIFNQKFLKEVL